MINRFQVVTIITGAMLSACLLLFHPARAGPIAAATPPAATQPGTPPHMRAYLFRGALGPIFSRGMDHLAERIEKAGIPADVNEFAMCNLIAESAIREYRKDPA